MTTEGEDLIALKLHGYVFDSDSVSGGSGSDLDDKYYSLKPPPVFIDPNLYTIVPISCRTQELNTPRGQIRKTKRSFSKRGKKGNHPNTRDSDSRSSRVRNPASCYTIDPPCSNLAQRIDKENQATDGIEHFPVARINTYRNAVANKNGSKSSHSTSSQRPTSSKEENIPDNFAVPTISESSRSLTPSCHKIVLPTGTIKNLQHHTVRSTSNNSNTGASALRPMNNISAPSNRTSSVADIFSPTGTIKTQNLQPRTVRSTSSNSNTGVSAPRNMNPISAISAPSRRNSARADIPYTQMRSSSVPREEDANDCPGCCCCQ